MCGVTGEINFDGRDLEDLHPSLERLASRGPDDQQIWKDDLVQFGHTRLKIMDLSDGSKQPMVDNVLGLSLVFNGAIYNYPEIRQELLKKGYPFNSMGDTEVILKAYHAWGPQCVTKFNGMFAFAIWDHKKQSLFAARDRLGIKPFYYANSGGCFKFSSFMPDLIHRIERPLTLDPFGLHCYFTFHAVVPAPYTLFKEIKKLPPGHTLTVGKDGHIRVDRYWELTFSNENQGMSENEALDTIDKELNLAIKRRMLAEVPVGVFLSGGVDSSILVAMAHQYTNKQLNTFSIGFESVRDEQGNEFKYSDLISKQFLTNHEKIVVKDSQALAELPNCIKAMSEPQVSHDAIGFYLLSQQVSKTNKAVLSGQGADEVFAGYHWYPKLAKSAHAISDYSALFFDRSFNQYKEIINPEFITEDWASHFITTHFQKPGAFSPLQKALRCDTTVMLVEDPVKRVDNMTMAWGLEARVPFLDHHLVEAAARIDSGLMVKGGPKNILKEVSRRYIPDEVIDRKKGYFPMPGLKYITGPYKLFVQEILSKSNSRRPSIVNSSYVKELLQSDPKDLLTPLNGSKLWQVACLEAWLDIHGVTING